MQVSPVEKPEYVWCLVTGQPYTDSEGQQSEYGRLETAASTRALCCTALQPTLGEGAEFDSPRPPLSRTSDLNLRLQGDKALSRSDDGKTRHCDDSRFSSSPSIFAWVFHLSLEWLYLFSGDGLWFLPLTSTRCRPIQRGLHPDKVCVTIRRITDRVQHATRL